MANTSRDDNRVPAILGVLNTDGTTPTRIAVTSDHHILQVSDGSTGSDLGNDVAVRDDNRIATWIAVSSSDGSTPVTLYVNSSNQLLINST